MARPIVPGRDKISNPPAYVVGSRHWNAKEQDAARRGQTGMSGEFAKTLVECEQNPALMYHPSQHL